MKKLFRCFVYFVGVLNFTSCEAIVFPGGSWVAERFPGIPEDYFYQTVGTCEAGDLSFHVLSGGGTILWDVPHTQSDADILTGQIDIFLNKDGTYTFRYREFSFNNEEFIKVLTSSYSFDSYSREIIFADLGTGLIAKTNNHYYLKLTLTTNINSTLLQGQTVDVWLRTSANGLDTDRAEYCNFRK